MTTSEVEPKINYAPKEKLWWLILGRLIVVLGLFLASLLWDANGRGSDFRAGILPFFAIVTGLTIIYSLAHRFTKALHLQVRIQFIVDLLLVTWLVWITDVISSPYIALYILIIAASSLFLGPRDAVVTSVGCAIAFTGCALAAFFGVGRYPAGSALAGSISKTVQTVGLFDIAFLIVGLLSARLAERQSRSDVRLMAATQSLADLRALHERIVESIRSGVVTTDLERRIYTFNLAAEEITGYRIEDVRGKDASIFFGELNQHISAALNAAEASATNPRFEADCFTAEGLRVRLGFSISPLFSETAETTGIVITFQDLTQVRVLEETARLQDRLAAIGRMAASIAHEIRNPLAAMRGSIQMLRSEMDGQSSQGELMEIILRESDRLNGIITDFLTYARPRSIIHSTIDVGQLLHETFTLLRHSPELNAHQIIEEEIAEGPLVANADAEQLRQVFWNLARNALQAMPDGGTLRASVENSENRLRITITDTGRGMSPAQVEQLFEPFSSTTGGTGLGLSIVYQIIRDHGGTINVRSRMGHGTIITVEIPTSIGERE